MATFGGRLVESKKWNKCGIQLNTVGQGRKVGFQLHKTGLMRNSSIFIPHYGAKVEELFHFHITFWGKSGGAPHSTHIFIPHYYLIVEVELNVTQRSLDLSPWNFHTIFLLCVPIFHINDLDLWGHIVGAKGIIQMFKNILFWS